MYSGWWEWDLRILAQFQINEMPPGLFQDIMDEYVKYYDSLSQQLNIDSGCDYGKLFTRMSFWYPWGANFLRNLCSKAVDIKKICNPSWGLRYWRSEFNYRWDIIIICFSIFILWTLCGKPMRGWQEALFYWFLFFWDALIVGGWGLRQNVLSGGNWNRIFLFLVFSQIGSAESRNAKEASRYLDFTDNCLIISHTR